MVYTDKLQLPENIKESRVLLRGPIYDVHSVKIPSRTGQLIEKQLVVHPGAVVILPLLPGDIVVMIRNQRFAIGKQLWELPAGTLEKNELPQDTAGRELIEETGYEAKRVTPLLEFYASPGYSTEKLYAYVAEDLHFVGQKLEETEQIVVEHIPLKQTLEMMSKGLLCDAKSIATILYYVSVYRS
jgi:ADP-ribose pyrophosphatase